MKSLNEDIKTGQFSQVYLLYGEENYLKRMYKNKLKEAMLPADDTVNYSYYEGKGIAVTEIIDLAETMPFFADRRLILIENSGVFKSANADFADYIKDIPETTCFIFVEEEIDKRGKMFKEVKKKGRIVELSMQDEQTLVRWVAGQVKKEGKSVTEATVRYLITKVGKNMEGLQNELEKLFAYTLDRSVLEVSDVDAVCTTEITNQIFDMVNAVAEKRQRQALDYYYDLLALKEPPMRILFLMTRQFRILLEVKELMQKGYGRKDISEKAKVPPFTVNKYEQQARAFSKTKLKEIIEAGADIEEDVKTGRLTDVLAVELFIVKYSLT